MKTITERWNLAVCGLKHHDYTSEQREAYCEGVYQVLLMDCGVDSPEMQELASMRLSSFSGNKKHDSVTADVMTG